MMKSSESFGKVNQDQLFGLQSECGSWHNAGMANDANTNKNPAAVALGRLGGLMGGPARTASMTAAQRMAAARKAALARWSKKKKKS
jgi:hypothetical protein